MYVFKQKKEYCLDLYFLATRILLAKKVNRIRTCSIINGLMNICPEKGTVIILKSLSTLLSLNDSKLKKNRSSIIAIFSKGIVMLHFVKKSWKIPKYLKVR